MYIKIAILFLHILQFSNRSFATCRSLNNIQLTFGNFFPPITTFSARSTEQVLTSPNYPSDYNPFEQCAYRITAPPGSVIGIRFDDFSVAVSTLDLIDGVSPFGGTFNSVSSINSNI